MIIDSNAYLGGDPFRELKYGNIKGLLKLLDRTGIDKSIVSSMKSIYHTNHETGNLELFSKLKKYPNRFVGLACINPTFPGAIKFMHLCYSKFGFRGLKLHPNYHGYGLTDEISLKLIEESAKLDWPVHIQMRMKDERMQHFLMQVAGTPVKDVLSVAELFPKVKFILGGAKPRELPETYKYGNVYFENSFISGPQNIIREMVKQVGSARILFGTHMPLLYPEAALLMIRMADISEEDRKRILGENCKNIYSL